MVSFDLPFEWGLRARECGHGLVMSLEGGKESEMKIFLAIVMIVMTSAMCIYAGRSENGCERGSLEELIGSLLATKMQSLGEDCQTMMRNRGADGNDGGVRVVWASGLNRWDPMIVTWHCGDFEPLELIFSYNAEPEEGCIVDILSCKGRGGREEKCDLPTLWVEEIKPVRDLLCEKLGYTDWMIVKGEGVGKCVHESEKPTQS